MTVDNTFTKIAEFQFSAEAQIIKGKLESAGIETFVRDGVTIDSDPLLSNALGGVKLFVRTEDLPHAQAILTEVNLFPVEDSRDTPRCPECGARNTTYASLLGGFFHRLFYSKTQYRCSDCGNEFKA